MKLLIILDDLPKPTNSGNRLVLASELLAFYKIASDQSVIVFSRDESSSGSEKFIADNSDRHLFVDRRGFVETTRSQPFLPYQYASRSLSKLALEKVATWPRPDVIIANHEWTLKAANHLREIWPGVRIVLRSHNDEQKFMQDVARSASGVRRIYSEFEARRTSAGFLKRVTSELDEVWTIAPADEEVYARLDQNVITMPPIAPISSGTIKKFDTCDTWRFGFLGALDMPHAVEGLEWFISMVWPSLLVQNSGAELVIAGRRADAALESRLRKTKGVRYLGEIADSAEFYELIDIFVNPVFAGSGINMKMLEPAQRGIPLVTTEIGTRGLESLGIDGKSSVEEFFQECISLAQDAGYRNTFSSRMKKGAQDYSSESFERRAISRLEGLKCPRV